MMAALATGPLVRPARLRNWRGPAGDVRQGIEKVLARSVIRPLGSRA